MKCIKCGAEIDDDSRYCDQCRARHYSAKEVLRFVSVSIVSTLIAGALLFFLLRPMAESPQVGVIDSNSAQQSSDNESLRKQLAERDSTIEMLQKEVNDLNKKVTSLKRDVNAYVEILKN